MIRLKLVKVDTGKLKLIILKYRLLIFTNLMPMKQKKHWNLLKNKLIMTVIYVFIKKLNLYFIDNGIKEKARKNDFIMG